MSQMKDIARGLSANGAAAGPTTKGHYLLYTDTGKLVVKLWTGETFSDEQLVSSSVRRGSTAGYVTLASNKSLAVTITFDSKLAVFQYDEEEEESDEEFPIRRQGPRDLRGQNDLQRLPAVQNPRDSQQYQHQQHQHHQHHQ